MVSLKSPSRMMYVSFVFIVLIWPCQAFAGWFVRDDQIAYRLEQQGQYRQALKYWDGSAKGLYGKGTTLMYLGRMREAEQAFRGSLEVAPHKTGFYDSKQMPANLQPHFMASLWYNLGNSLYAQGELRGARQAWQKALSYEPGHSKAKHNLEIVDRLLGSKEHQEQMNLANMNGADNQKKPDKHAKHRAGRNQNHQQSHPGLLALHLPGRHQQGSSSGNNHGINNGSSHSLASQEKGSKKRSGKAASQTSMQTRKRLPGPDLNSQHGHQQENVQGMSKGEAVQELRMVEEGVSVFLRHRLGKKGPHGISSDGGKPW